MSLRRSVAELVQEMGQATADDLVPLLQEYNRVQILKALHNACRVGMLTCDGRAPRRGIERGGAAPATYRPAEGPPQMRKAPERKIHARPPNSAFELGHGLQIAGKWPPQGQGRRFSPLGSWDAA